MRRKSPSSNGRFVVGGTLSFKKKKNIIFSPPSSSLSLSPLPSHPQSLSGSGGDTKIIHQINMSYNSSGGFFDDTTVLGWVKDELASSSSSSLSSPFSSLSVVAVVVLCLLAGSVVGIAGRLISFAIRRSLHEEDYEATLHSTRLRYMAGPRGRSTTTPTHANNPPTQLPLQPPTVSLAYLVSSVLYLHTTVIGVLVWVIAEVYAVQRINEEQDKTEQALIILQSLLEGSGSTTLTPLASSSESSGVPLLLLLLLSWLGFCGVFVYCKLVVRERFEGIAEGLRGLSNLEGLSTETLEAGWGVLCSITEFNNIKTCIFGVANHLGEYKRYLPEALLYRVSSFQSPMSPGVKSPGARSNGSHRSLRVPQRMLSWGESEFIASQRSETSHDPEDVLTPPPGTYLAVVFVDIWGITNLWKDFAEEMTESIPMYTDVIRLAVEAHDGVEVKTLGDAFMIVFDDACSAVQFGLECLEELNRISWPSRLRESRFCARLVDSTGTVLFNGLRPRIGVAYGQVQQDSHLITDQLDYSGKTVVRAARMEASGIPGAVTVASEVVGQLQHRMKDLVIITDDKAADTIILNEALMSRQLEIEGSIEERGRRLAKKPPPLNTSHIRSEVSCGSWTAGPQEEKKSNLTFSAAVSVAAAGSAYTTPKQDPLRKFSDVVVGRVRFVCVEDILSDRAASLGENMNEALSCLLASLRATGGHTLSVLGGSVSVWWNGHASKLTSLLRFPTLLSAKLRKVDLLTPHVGLCQGNVMYGCIGASDMKYIQAMGQPLGMSSLLSETAIELGVAALMTRMKGHNRTFVENLRPIDEWRARDGPKFTIYEVMKNPVAPDGAAMTLSHAHPLTLFCPESTNTHGDASEDMAPSSPLARSPTPSLRKDPPAWEWSEEYTHAFFAKDFATIKERTSGREVDAVLQIVAHLIETGSHLRTHLHMGVLQ